MVRWDDFIVRRKLVPSSVRHSKILTFFSSSRSKLVVFRAVVLYGGSLKDV